MNSFIFGGNTGLSYEDLQRRRRQVEEANKKVYRPRTPGQGLSALGHALATRMQAGRLREDEAKGQEGVQSAFAEILAGRTAPGNAEGAEGAGGGAPTNDLGFDPRLAELMGNPHVSPGQQAMMRLMAQRSMGNQDAERAAARDAEKRSLDDQRWQERFDAQTGFTAEQNELNRQAAADTARLRTAAASGHPAAVREWQYFVTLKPEEQQQFLALKRNPQFLNLGDQFLRPDALNPGQTVDARGVGVAPETKIQDDRIVTAPGVPGAVPNDFPGQQQEPDNGATDARAHSAPGVPEVVPSQTEPTIQNLPPSPDDVRRQLENRRLKGEKFDTVDSRFQQILDTMDGAFLPTTGMVGGQVLSGFGNTAAHDVASDLDSIKGIIGFGELQAMREASPTGGALGQVSELENRLLQAQYGSLAQSQSEDQFRRNLQTVRDTFRRVVHEGVSEGEASEALERMQGAGVPPSTPDQPQRRRFNPETGRIE